MTQPQQVFNVPSSSLLWIIDPKDNSNNIYLNGEHIKTFSQDAGYSALEFVCVRFPGIPCVMRFGENGNGFIFEFSNTPKPDQDIFVSLETVIHKISEPTLPFWKRPITVPAWFAATWIILSISVSVAGMLAIIDLMRFCWLG